MLELSTLVFKVDTKQLTEAIEKTNDLAAAQKQLATAMTKGSGSASASQQQQKQTRTQQDLLKKLKDLYGDLSDGATRWEASQLRAARNLGVPLAEVEDTLKKIKSLSPLTSFDSSIGAVRKMKAEFESLQNRVELTKQGITASKTELEAFGRIPFQVEGSMRKRGADPERNASEYQMRVESNRQQFIETAKAVSDLRNAEKDRLDVVKQTTQSSKFLATEMQRVDAVLAEMNNEFGLNANTGERSAAMVAKYSTALQRAGVSGVEAAAKLETYRAKVQQIAMQDEKRAATRLSRALTPQISDVAVSIAGGMPLHLVIMQQGLQIRDLIAQSGVAAQTLQGVFKTAAADMVKSIGGTIAALGSLTFGAIVDAGGAINSFATKILMMNGVLDTMNAKFPQAAQGLSRFMSVLSGGLLAAALVTVGALTYEYVKLIGANDDLVRALALSGGAFNLTYQSSGAYVQSLVAVGATTREAIAVITQMADSSKFASSQITLVGKSAVEMEKYAGVAIKDTVKAFEDMAKDPIKGLSELAIKTGAVTPEVMKLARQLVLQGEGAKAAALGVQELSKFNESAAKKMQEDLHPVLLMLREIARFGKEGISGFFDFSGIFQSNEMKEALAQMEKVQDLRTQIQSREKRVSGVEISTPAQKAYVQETERLKENLRLLKQSADARKSYLSYEQQIALENSKAEKQTQKRIELENKYNLSGEKQRRLAELEGDRKSSGMTDAEYKREKKKIEDAYTDKKLASEINKEKAYGLSVQEKLNDAYNRMLGTAQQLNEVEKAILDIRDDAKYKQASPAQRAEMEKQIEEKRKLVEASKAVALVEKEEADIAANVAALRKKNYTEISDLYKELSIHGEKYEKTLLAINYAEMMGMDSSEAAALRKANLQKNSDAFKFGKKTVEDQKKSALDLLDSEEDLKLRRAEIGRTDRTNQLARAEFDQKKQLRQAYAEFVRQEDEILEKTEGQTQADLLTSLEQQYQRRRSIIMGEAELKKTLLSEEVQRQKNFDDTMKRGFESMGDALIDFAVTGKSSFGDMIKQMLIDLAKLEMRLQMMKMYEAVRGGSSGTGGGGMFGGLLGNVFGGTPFGGGFTDVGGIGAAGSSALSSILGDFFANGGSPPMGKVSVVGEQGPELFIPKQQGTIIPNHQLGGTKKVVNMNQTYNIQIDSRSDQASIYAGVQSMLKQNNAQLVDSLQTGGYL